MGAKAPSNTGTSAISSLVLDIHFCLVNKRSLFTRKSEVLEPDRTSNFAKLYFQKLSKKDWRAFLFTQLEQNYARLPN
jgi:hypothetical protein